MASVLRARHWHRQGDLARAIPAYQNALQVTPQDFMLWHDYGVALLQSRRAADAVVALQQALRIAPNRFEVQLAMSQAYQISGQIQVALVHARAATHSRPADPHGWLLRGRQEAIAGALGPAESSLRSALLLAPALDEAWHYLGEVLQRKGDWDEAIKAYTLAMRTQPGEIMNVAICLERVGRWREARDAYRRMCTLHPERRDCLVRLAQAAAMLCDFETESDAVARLKAIMAEDECDAGLLDDCPEPFVLSYLPVTDAMRRRALQGYVRRIERRVNTLPVRTSTAPGRRRIGYIGADFGRHAVGTLIRGLFASHDRERFYVIGYSLKRHDDIFAKALNQEFDIFRDFDGVPTIEIAKRIRDDRIDILIDLGGYTGGARPEILAMRPSPIQLSWLGFIHAHEAPWLDGLILDDFIQSSGEDWPFTDTLLRLPSLLLPCGPMPSGTPDRQRFDLPDNVPLFASFNSSYKLDSELIEAWIEILRRTDDSHLALYLQPEARSHFVFEWRKRGGDERRLHLLGHLPPDAQADRAASCDLFLDAFRYQAGATAMACVAAGLPILSRRGTSALGRLSAGLNRFLGLDALICADKAEYIDRAVMLGSDRNRLSGLRTDMRCAAERMRLFDPKRGAEAIEVLIDRLLGPQPTIEGRG